MQTKGIIDFHTHFFPPVSFENPASLRDEMGEKHWYELMFPQNKKSLQGWVLVDDMLDKMNQSGISQCVLMGWYWQNNSTCVLQNEWFAKLCRQHPDRFKAFASLSPCESSELDDQLKRIVDEGFIGIGEIHPTVQGFSLKDDWCKQVADYCVKHGLLINLHVTEPVGRSYEPREESDFREIQSFIESYPELKLILSHWGGLIFMHELNPYIQKTWKNVYYDTSATPLLYRSDIYRIASQVLPPEKVLYGSDFPLMVYPKDQKTPDFSRYLNDLQKNCPDNWLNAILRENAQKLFQNGN